MPKIEFEPIRIEEIPPPSKEDLELELMWNLRLFPFLLKNYDRLFKERQERRYSE